MQPERIAAQPQRIDFPQPVMYGIHDTIFLDSSILDGNESGFIWDTYPIRRYEDLSVAQLTTLEEATSRATQLLLDEKSVTVPGVATEIRQRAEILQDRLKAYNSHLSSRMRKRKITPRKQLQAEEVKQAYEEFTFAVTELARVARRVAVQPVSDVYPSIFLTVSSVSQAHDCERDFSFRYKDATRTPSKSAMLTPNTPNTTDVELLSASLERLMMGEDAALLVSDSDFGRMIYALRNDDMVNPDIRTAANHLKVYSIFDRDAFHNTVDAKLPVHGHLALMKRY